MLRIILFSVLLLTAAAGRAQAQTSLTLRADYDSFFGAYPTVQVQRPMGPTAALLAYGTYYTQTDFYGLEAGVGARFGRGRRWAVQPTLALGSGSFFLSNPAPWVSGEALVPSLTIERSWGRTECVATGAYYTAMRRREANSYDFFWGQLSAGWQLGQRRTVSLAGLGALLATVSQPRNLADEQPALSTFYITRLGGLLTWNLPHNAALLAGGGWSFGSQKPYFLQVAAYRTFGHAPRQPLPNLR